MRLHFPPVKGAALVAVQRRIRWPCEARNTPPPIIEIRLTRERFSGNFPDFVRNAV